MNTQILTIIYDIANIYHANQFREKSNRAYITHPITVVELLLYCGVTDIAVLSAAYLHDVLEECEISPNDLYKMIFSKIKQFDSTGIISARIVEIVQKLTLKINEVGYKRKYRKQLYLANIAVGADTDFDTFIIKIADRLENIMEFYSDGNISYAKKYMLEAASLFGKLFYMQMLDSNNTIINNFIKIHETVAKKVKLK